MDQTNKITEGNLEKIFDNNPRLVKTPTFIFKDNQWQEIKITNIPILKEDEICFLTYNIWFGKHNFQNRIKEISNILEKYSPDFICLQEVTQTFLDYIKDKKFIQDNYCYSGNLTGYYDVLILSKHQVNFYFRKFNSNQSRKLLTCETFYSSNSKSDNNMKSLVISTTHLESLIENTKYRQEQLKVIFDLLKTCENCFTMGDFNYDPSSKEEVEIYKDKYNDLFSIWKEKYNLTEEDGYTRPPQKTKQVRFDRLIFCKNENLELSEFSVIGKDPIEQDVDVGDDKELMKESIITTPSDHYGLYAKFTLK